MTHRARARALTRERGANEQCVNKSIHSKCDVYVCRRCVGKRGEYRKMYERDKLLISSAERRKTNKATRNNTKTKQKTVPTTVT